MNQVGNINIASSQGSVNLSSGLNDIKLVAKEDIHIVSNDSGIIVKSLNGPILMQTNSKVVILGKVIDINNCISIDEKTLKIHNLDIFDEILDLKKEISMLKNIVKTMKEENDFLQNQFALLLMDSTNEISDE